MVFGIAIQDEHRIHRTADTRCAGEPVHRITVPLLSQMVYQQNGDTVVVSNPFQLVATGDVPQVFILLRYHPDCHWIVFVLGLFFEY